MAFQIKDFDNVLKNPYSLTTDQWSQWKSGYEGWKKNYLAGLASQERNARQQYADFTSQAASRLACAVSQMKTAVGRNALARGIERSTIPGTVIGAETERLNGQYEQQDEAAKTELDQALNAISASKKNLNNIQKSMNWIDGVLNSKTTREVDYSILNNVPTDVAPSLRKNLDEQQQQLDSEYSPKNYTGYDTESKAYLKDRYNLDDGDYDPNSTERTLGNILYWQGISEFNGLSDILSDTYSKDVTKYKDYTNMINSGAPAEAVDAMRQYAPADPGTFDLVNEFKNLGFTDSKGGINTAAIKSYVKDYSDKSDADHKETARLMGESDQSNFTPISESQDDWKSLGYTYDLTDSDDMKREERGLPPKSFLKEYKDTPDDQLRKWSGQLPGQIDDELKTARLKQALGYNDPNRFVDSKIPPSEKQLQETSKAPSWEGVEQSDNTQAVLSYTPSGGRVAIYKGDDNKFHAVKEWKDGTNTEVGGPYDSMDAAQSDVDAHWDAIANGPKFGQVITSAWHEGNASIGAAFVRDEADFEYLMEELSGNKINPQDFITDTYNNYNDYASNTINYINKAISNPDELYLSGDMTDTEAGIVSTVAQNVKALLAAGNDLSHIKIDQFSNVSIVNGDVSDEARTKNLIGVMSALDIIPLSVALQSRAEDLTALAQQHAQERKTDNGFLKTVGDIVTAVPSTAGGMVASAINPVLGAAYWGTLGYGEGANLAQQMGASYGQQALYGGADAIVSMLTGSLDLPGAAKAPVTELFNRELLDQGIKAISKTGLKVLVGMGEGVAKNEIQQIALNAVQKGIFDSGMPWLGKGGVVDPQQMLDTAKNGVAMSLALDFIGMGKKAGKYILDKINDGEEPDITTAIQINKEQDAPNDPQAAVMAKNIDESAKSSEPLPQYKDTGIHLDQKIGQNDRVLSGLPAKALTTMLGDVPNDKIYVETDKQNEIVRKEPLDTSKGKSYYTAKYGNVGRVYEPQNDGKQFKDVTKTADAELVVSDKTSYETAGKEGKQVEYSVDTTENTYIKNKKLLEINQFTKDILNNKPKNSPTPERWLEDGGKIYIDEDGVWTYLDWENHSVSYPNGYPDFKSAGLEIQKVELKEFKGYNFDLNEADRIAYERGTPRANTSTWHHNQDMKTLQEIDWILHSRFYHSGGMSLARKMGKVR